MKLPVFSLKWRLAAAMMVLTLGVSAFVGYALNQSKLQKEAEVAETVQNFTRLLDQSISNSAQKVDLSLLDIADQLQEDLRARGHLDGPRVNRLLLQHRTWLSKVGDFRVTDTSGLVRFGPSVDKDSKISYGDRAFFVQQRDALTQKLLVSDPVLSRVSELWVVVLSRRYNYPDGRFAGVIAAAVPLSYFSALLGELNLGPNGVALLRDSQGGMLARYPMIADPSAQIGAKIYSKELGQIMASGQTAVVYHTPKTGDGVERIVSYRRLAGVPFQLVVGVGPGDYLADWRSQSQKSVIAAAGFLLLSGFFTWGIWRSFSASEKSRRQSEQMLGERNEALRSLEAQTQLLREVVESLPYGLVVYDERHVMRLHNTKFVQILRLPVEFIDRGTFSFPEFVRFSHQRGDYGDSESAEQLLARYTRAMDARQVLTGEREQTYGAFIEFRTFPISQGWTAITYLDNTQRHHEQSVLRDTQERVRLATESAGLGIWELDVQSGELMWDAQQYRLFGMTPGSGSGRYDMWAQRVHPDDLSEAVAALQAVMLNGSDYICEFRVVWTDGSVRHIRALGRPRMDAQGKVVRMVGTNRDVTDALNSAQSLKDARDAAQEANISKSQFLANMSHEIRTPMNAILGLLQLLGGTPLTPHQLDYVDKIDGAARSLLGLLNDILDFSKIEAQKLDLEIEPFDTDRLLRDLAVVLSAYVGTKEIEVLYDIDAALPSVLVGDALRLRQVMVNLGGNAIKFTTQGQVIVGLRVIELLAGSPDIVVVEFSVRDTGIGIAPENLPRLFNSFSQAEASTTRRFGGSGLGLAICKRLVELMGGAVELYSEVGVGTTFSFRLHLPAGPADATPALKPVTAAVLLIDDNPAACTLMARMMQGLGWQVDVARSAEEAVERVSARVIVPGRAYALVFVDSQLAGIDGWATVTRLRQLVGKGDHDQTKYIMVSVNGRDSLERRTQQEQAQIHDFIVKPVTPSMLIKAAQRERSSAATLRRSPRSGKRELSGLRILVVEDNAINQQVAEELLSGVGALVSIAANGRLGVNAVASATPQYDIVLMDIQMPVMDGYEATQVIRESLSLPDLPIIGLTANAMASDRERCLRSGMNEHLSKPYDLAQLVSMVMRLTGHNLALHASVGDDPTMGAATMHEGVEMPDQIAANGVGMAGLDLSGALKRMGGMTALYVRAAQQMLNDLPALVPTLQRLAKTDQLQDLLVTLHTYKGTVATLGLTDLSTQLAALEAQLKSGPGATELEQYLPVLTEVIGQGVQELHQALLQLDRAAQDRSIDTQSQLNGVQDLQPALQQLVALLEQDDMGALEVFSRLQSIFNQLPDADFDRLELALQNLELEQALYICKKLILA
jgi:PAS domain S-box-containing protein